MSIKIHCIAQIKLFWILIYTILDKSSQINNVILSLLQFTHVYVHVNIICDYNYNVYKF